MITAQTSFRVPWILEPRRGWGQVGFQDPGLTALWQHALLHLLQFLIAVSEFRKRFEHSLAGPHALPTGHAAVAPLRPWRQQAWDGV